MRKKFPSFQWSLKFCRHVTTRASAHVLLVSQTRHVRIQVCVFGTIICSHTHSYSGHIVLSDLYNTCTADGSGDPLCGDGIVQGEEECDCGIPKVFFPRHTCT